MSVGAKRRATYDDLFALPENVVGEIIAGEVVASPRPAIPHAVATSSLGAELGGAFQRGKGGPGGWWILYEPELHLGGDVLVPDIAGWRIERMPKPPPDPYFTMAPDWVCEVLSPSTARLDRTQKLPIYARERVGFAWLIDPASQTLEVLRREGEYWLLVGTFSGQDRVRTPPFEAIELELGALWIDTARGP